MLNLKILSTIIFSIFISGCSLNTFQLFDYDNLSENKKALNFQLKGETKKITLDKYDFKYTHSSCTNESYVLKGFEREFGNLYIETIDLSQSCSWNGLASGYFIYEFKSKNKFNSFELINRIVKDNYEISTYLVNDSKYIDIIDIFSVNRNVLIIDYDGKLSSFLSKKLDPTKPYDYETLDRLEVLDYNYSLVDNNFFKAYFGFESMGDDDRP